MNPANWMLEVTSPAAEQALGVDFAQVWSNSSNARWDAGWGGKGESGGRAVCLTMVRLLAYWRSHYPCAFFCLYSFVERRVEKLLCAARHIIRRAAQALIDEHTVGALERLQEGPAPVARDVETGGAAAPGEEPPSSGPAALSRYARPTLVQLRLVLGRALVSQLRNPAYNVMRLAITLGLGLALGSLYWGTGRDRWVLGGTGAAPGMGHGHGTCCQGGIGRRTACGVVVAAQYKAYNPLSCCPFYPFPTPAATRCLACSTSWASCTPACCSCPWSTCSWWGGGGGGEAARRGAARLCCNTIMDAASHLLLVEYTYGRASVVVAGGVCDDVPAGAPHSLP